ncbi:MAG: glycosyltransferase family 4 protein [Bacteroidales bacterium]|nr:glycosyltransferase family 4 protein [Bacteroidales bacterium]
MNILMLTTKVPYPPKDGGARATLDLALGLSKQGHVVDFLCMNTPKHHVRMEEFPAEILSTFQWFLVNVDTSIRVWPLMRNYFFSSLPYSVERFTHPVFAKKLEDLLRSKKYDIIQIEGLYGIAYVGVIRKACSSKIVFRPHNIEHLIWRRLALQEKNVFKKIYFKRFAHRLEEYEKKVINQYDLLIPISEEDAHFFRKAGNNKPMQVVPYGIDVESILIKTDIKKDIFFLGALDWIPNLEGLRWFADKVFPLIKEKLPGCEFWVAGRNPREGLKDELMKWGIRCVGEIENASVFMQEHGVMVVPLFAGSGIRVKIIEAMAHGKAVVATPIAAEGIPVENEKHILISQDPQQMADYIVRLLSDDELHKQIQIQARSFIKSNFSIHALVQDLEKAYSQILTK